jgi:uncharacterized YigZ family protein
VNYTVVRKSEGIYKEKGSKFIAFLYPVADKLEIDKRLQEIKKDFFDARHICYAYRLGQTEYCTDGGEPSHTAGSPILRQIYAAELNNVLLVVIRYFGGTKLGVPGLIRAYEAAARYAIENNERIEWYETLIIRVRFGYEYSGRIKNTIQQRQIQILSSDFNEDCTYSLAVRKEEWTEIQSLLEKYAKQITVLS